MAKKPRKTKGWKRIGDPITEVDIHPKSKFELEYVEIAAKLKSAGFTYEDIGYVLGVSAGALQNWEKRYPQFAAAMEDGKENAIVQLVAKSMRLASGYDYEECNEKYRPVVKEDGTNEMQLIERSVFKKHQPPNPKMLMFLLCNSDPENWKSEHKIEVNHNDHISVKLDGAVASQQIAALAGKLLETPRKMVESHEIIETDEQSTGLSDDNSEESTG